MAFVCSPRLCVDSKSSHIHIYTHMQYIIALARPENRRGGGSGGVGGAVGTVKTARLRDNRNGTLTPRLHGATGLRRMGRGWPVCVCVCMAGGLGGGWGQRVAYG